MVHAGGYDHAVNDFGYIEHGDGETIAAFKITPQVAAGVAGASEIGGKVFNLDKSFSYGNAGEVVDPQVCDMVDGCMRHFSRSALAAPSSAPALMPRKTRESGWDIQGADLLSNGIRGISLDECGRQCLAASDCAALSYVIEKQ